MSLPNTLWSAQDSLRSKVVLVSCKRLYGLSCPCVSRRDDEWYGFKANALPRSASTLEVVRFGLKRKIVDPVAPSESRLMCVGGSRRHA